MESSTQTEMHAAAWIARRDRGGLSAEEQAELDRWLRAATANRIAFIRLDAAWREADRLKVLGAGLNSGVMPGPGQWRQSPFFGGRSSVPDHPAPIGSTASEIDESVLEPSPGNWVAGSRLHGVRQAFKALAACVLLAIVVSSHREGMPSVRSYRTEIGAQTTVPMVDGSTVTLNTNSEIHIAVSEAERRVKLDRGEAFFEVAKDGRRVFVVNVEALRVIAVGTKFSVRREGDQLRVVVTEGRVQVAKTDQGRSMPIAQLSAGNIAHTQGEGVLVQEQPLSRLEELLSWRAGFVVFHRTPLAEAVAEFNRYNARKIVITDPGVAAIRISGNFRTTNGDAFARLLEAGFPIRAEVSEAQIVLQSK